jgi:hypothetical protein
MLQISFLSREIREICEDDTRAEAFMGPRAARALRHRVEDLRAASSVSDVVAGNMRAAQDPADGSVRVLDLDENWVMCIRPAHSKVAHDAQGKIDWTRVSRVQVFEFHNESNEA